MFVARPVPRNDAFKRRHLKDRECLWPYFKEVSQKVLTIDIMHVIIHTYKSCLYSQMG